MRLVFISTIKTKAFDAVSNAIRNRQRIGQDTAIFFLYSAFKALLHFPDGANKRSRITAIKFDWIKSTTAQMTDKTLHAFDGAKLSALFNTTTISNHNR